MVLLLVIGLATGCIYALVAIGFSLTYRTTGVVNFAQGGYVMLGGTATYWFHEVAALPYVIAIGLGVVVASLAGALLWWAVVLPLWRMRSPPYIVLIETIVSGIILALVALIVLGPAPKTLPAWLPGAALEIDGNRIDGQYIIASLVTLVFVGLLIWVLNYSNLGRSMRAAASNRQMGELMGISPERMGLVAFVATAALGGLGGAIITPSQFTAWDVGLIYGVFGFVAAVLGGFGSITGALLGGLLLGFINVFVARYISSSYQTVIAFGLLIALLTVRPSGIVGRSWDEQ